MKLMVSFETKIESREIELLDCFRLPSDSAEAPSRNLVFSLSWSPGKVAWGRIDVFDRRVMFDH